MRPIKRNLPAGILPVHGSVRENAGTVWSKVAVTDKLGAVVRTVPLQEGVVISLTAKADGILHASRGLDTLFQTLHDKNRHTAVLEGEIPQESIQGMTVHPAGHGCVYDIGSVRGDIGNGYVDEVKLSAAGTGRYSLRRTPLLQAVIHRNAYEDEVSGSKFIGTGGTGKGRQRKGKKERLFHISAI